MSTDRRICASRANVRNSRAVRRALKQLHDLRRNRQSKNNQSDLIPNMDTNRNPQTINNQSDGNNILDKVNDLRQNWVA